MIDYLRWQESGQDPLDAAMAGYKQGLQQKQAGEDRAMKMEDRATAQAKAAAQVKRAELMQADMFALSQNKTASAKDYANMALKYREMAEPLMEAYELMSDEQQRNERKKATVLFAAIDSGQLEMANSIAERSLESAKGSGDQEAIDVATMISNTIKQDPDSAKAIAGIILAESMGEEKFASTLEKLRSRVDTKELDALKLRKIIAETGLTTAQTQKIEKEVEGLGIESQKAIVELEAMKSGIKPIDQEKVFKFEKDLRGEYVKMSSGMDSADLGYSKMLESAKANTGQGDMSIIFGFMKMLDEGSVVRESEYAQAQKTAGLLTSLQQKYKNMINGEKLKPKERVKFLSLAKKYYEEAQKHVNKKRKALDFSVKKYNLSPEAVFGGEVEGASEVKEDYNPNTPTTEEAAASVPSYMRHAQSGAQ